MRTTGPVASGQPVEKPGMVQTEFDFDAYLSESRFPHHSTYVRTDLIGDLRICPFLTRESI